MIVCLVTHILCFWLVKRPVTGEKGFGKSGGGVGVATLVYVPRARRENCENRSGEQEVVRLAREGHSKSLVDRATTSILISFLRYHIMFCRRNTQPSSLPGGVGSETRRPSAQA
jgi:hypothetical protein